MVTERQIHALKYLISNARDGSSMVKQILWFLIDQSKSLTEEVCVTLTQDCGGFERQEIHRDALTMSSLTSSNCTTHIDQILIAMGTEFCFSVHYGNFDEDGKFNPSGMFSGIPRSMVSDESLTVVNAPMRYTYWLAKKGYSGTARVIPVSRAELVAIDLSKPGLYPHFEKQSLFR